MAPAAASSGDSSPTTCMMRYQGTYKLLEAVEEGRPQGVGEEGREAQVDAGILLDVRLAEPSQLLHGGVAMQLKLWADLKVEGAAIRVEQRIRHASEEDPDLGDVGGTDQCHRLVAHPTLKTIDGDGEGPVDGAIEDALHVIEGESVLPGGRGDEGVPGTGEELVTLNGAEVLEVGEEVPARWLRGQKDGAIE